MFYKSFTVQKAYI